MTVLDRAAATGSELAARIVDGPGGYTGVSGDEEWAAEVRRLATQRGATLLAHNYQLPAIQDVADHVGDSLALSRIAAEARLRAWETMGVDQAILRAGPLDGGHDEARERIRFLAGVELDRRQVAQAGRVCGVSDGARWIQRFFDSCCAAAIRILDFPHAVGYLAQAGAAYFEGTPEALVPWLAAQRKELKEGKPQRVVAELHRLSLAAHEQDAPEALQNTLAEAHDYLKSRLPMIEYAHFQAQGDPIGSGASESANKLVVERRLRGAGMHWQRRNVNPMLTLTNAAANERWDELWPAATAHQRLTRRQRLLDKHAPPPPAPPPPRSPPPRTPWQPAPDHPWRRYPTPPRSTPLAA